MHVCATPCPMGFPFWLAPPCTSGNQILSWRGALCQDGVMPTTFSPPWYSCFFHLFLHLSSAGAGRSSYRPGKCTSAGRGGRAEALGAVPEEARVSPHRDQVRKPGQGPSSCCPAPASQAHPRSCHQTKPSLNSNMCNIFLTKWPKRNGKSLIITSTPSSVIVHENLLPLISNALEKWSRSQSQANNVDTDILFFFSPLAGREEKIQKSYLRENLRCSSEGSVQPRKSGCSVPAALHTFPQLCTAIAKVKREGLRVPKIPV